MDGISLECVIDGQPYSTQQLDAIEHARHIHVLHDMKRLGTRIVHHGHTLTDDGINLLSAVDARETSIATRRRLGPDGVRELFKLQLRASDEMWKSAQDVSNEAQMQVGETDLTIRGISFDVYHKAISMDRLVEIYPLLNPDHFFAEHNDKGLVVVETFGMHGGPSELYIHPKQDIVVPVKRLDDYPILVAGLTTLRDGSDPNMLAYHQFKPMEDGFQVRLCCTLPPNSPKEIVNAHKVHMAIEIWQGAKLAAAKM